MRLRFAFVLSTIAAASLSACSVKNPLYCDDRVACEDPARPYCDVDGKTMASGGIRHTCVPSPDAGVTAEPDAGATDADSGTSDHLTHRLTILLAGTGTGTVSSRSGAIDCGARCRVDLASTSTLTLYATSDENSEFVGWAGGGCSGTDPCSLILSEDISVSATFARKQYSLSISRTGDGTGDVRSDVADVDCGSMCNAVLSAGTTVHLSAMPGMGSTFGGWSGACAGLTSTCDVTIQGPTMVGAAFDFNRFSLGVSLGGTGGGEVTANMGQIHCPGTCSAGFSPGTLVTLTAAADAYSRFDGWAGACSGAATCRVTMDTAQSVVAIFTDTSFKITLNKQGLGAGTITSVPLGLSCGATCTGRFPAGSAVTLISTPDPGSRFSGWSGPCLGKSSMCNIPAGSNQTVGATFDRNIIRGIALGLAHTCALLDPGVVRCYGSGANGRLGYGDTMSRGDGVGPPPNAADVPLGAVATQIAAGNAHTCAILSGGRLRCWGEGMNGKLGYGDTSDRFMPSADVPLGTATVRQVGLGSSHTCVLTMTGTVRCWGDNSFGQLGYGDTNERDTPGPDVTIFGSAHVNQLAVGGRHTCVLLDNGHVRCWGRGGWGELGYGDTNNRGSAPTNTPVMSDVPIGNVTVGTLVASGGDTCALTTGGVARCWGYGGQGQLGRGNTSNIGDDAGDSLSQDVPVGFTASQIAVGPHLCALSSAGAIRCWGLGSEGALGYGDTQNRGDGTGPIPAAGNVPISGTASSITVGFDQTCAIMSTGGLRCWGGNGWGQLGYGDRTTRGDGVGPSAASGDVPVF